MSESWQYFDEDGYPVELCEHNWPLGSYCHRCAVESGLEEEDGEDNTLMGLRPILFLGKEEGSSGD